MLPSIRQTIAIHQQLQIHLHNDNASVMICVEMGIDFIYQKGWDHCGLCSFRTTL